ncbi:protein telomere ends associated-like [Teleopsis dalmanni]|uniref:protein telomere ends associated-like n=1 Tax=Teleopsis dalmanni TaxID=139649 RepID=UPI0018CCA7DC|nr:protein telomere ends associated-like [Teleopsis dalmanni]
MSPRKRKNVKQTKITNIKRIKTKKTQTSPKPKEDISLQEKPREELKTRSVFPVTIDEFIENTNIIEVIKDYIKDKYSTALETYLTAPEIMSRVKNTYNVFYKRPQRRCMAPMKYVRITSDCDENTKQRLFKIPEYYKHLCENKDNEHQSVKKSLKKQDSSPNKNINSITDKKILEEKILGLKSIISNFDVNNKETNEKECNLPVSFETFKRFTFHNDVIDNICQSIKELEYELPISNISKEELFDNNKLLRSYYKTFYMQTVIRTIFPLKIKPCPGRLKDKLLKYPEITSDHEEPTVSNRDVIKSNTKEHLNKKTKLGSRKEDKNMEKCSLALEIKASKDNDLHHSYMDEKTSNEKIQVLRRLKSFIIPNFDDKNAELQKHNPPVSLEIFKKYTLYNEVIDQIYQDMIHTDCSLIILKPSEEKFLNRDRLLQSYYKAFYFQPNIRKLYRLRVKPCPAHLKAKLLSLPKKMYNAVSENDSTTSIENNENVDHNIITSVVAPFNKKTKLNQILQNKAVKENTERNSKLHESKFKTKTTKTPESSSPAKVLLWKQDYPNETKQTSATCIMEPIISGVMENEVVKDSAEYHLVPCPSNLRAKLGNLAVKNNDNAVVLPKGPQLTTKYDDSKFSLKFQDFLMGTNVLDLLIKTYNTTDDDLVNIAFEYYIKFVTNPVNPNVELFKNLMIHANEKSVKSFYTIYTQNKKDSSKEVKAIEDMQGPKASKSINKNNMFPVSIAEFKKYTYYKEVLLQILKEKAKGDEELFAKLRRNKLVWKKALRLYYTNFFFKPSIRKKYTLRLKEMPQSLKAKFLEIPAKSTTVKEKKKCDKNHLKSDRESNYTYFDSYKPLSDEFLLMYISKKVSDVNKHPEILKRIKENKQPHKRQSGIETISIETIVPPNIENEITLDEQSPVIPEENMEIFNKLFDPIPLKCTLSYVLRFSFGPKQSVLRTLMHISFEDFCKFTNIYQLSNIYNDKLKLFKIYESTIKKDIWPFNLYMRISDIFLYLLLNDVKLDLSDLQHISPKFLHWSDLAVNTDFNEIVKEDYFNMNGERIDGDEQLQISRESFYTRCWNEDDWIWRIPKITNNSIQEKINVTKALSDEDAEQLTVEKKNVKDSYISLEKCK